ncbi:acid protease [Metschnikowia bicuspidata var. bicuspidata NRRL YB-4993]|uniref:Acid protease n=1 Tax=Metschnikowia bicuspidata var. bicuspidata NRRL YB-4993 TaxID=869754 RepID=A0A1A0HFR2_9ASCO|nr:acid protease [Metschnikowia bicuspidata var. bicuspidata NRRL YB-4993]OBA22825.1 acid protease [Metschnikowia bicuspidata var. bicuspidata NRRL YB-4993]
MGILFEIEYIDNSLYEGKFFMDTLRFGLDGHSLKHFQFGVSNTSDPGILGLGSKSLESATTEYDNLPWTLQKAGITSKACYSLYLNPDRESGSIVFGGIDTAKFSGRLKEYPIYGGASDLAIYLSSLIIGDKVIPVESPYAFDSGSSIGFVGKELMYALDMIFKATIKEEEGIGYRFVDCKQPDDIYLVFSFDDNNISIPYADLILPKDGFCILGLAYFNDYQILGHVFMRHTYMYFDLTENTISLAQALFSKKSNIITF